MARRKAVFRADAGTDIGGGHVTRCLTLARALQNRGWTCNFVSIAGSRDVVSELAEDSAGMIEINPDKWNSTASLCVTDRPDLLVIDHYGLDAKFESDARQHAGLVMAIEDRPGRYHDCDILFDQTFGRRPDAYRKYMANPDATVLAGSQYALLRPSFSRFRAKALGRSRKNVERVLISFGATDPFGLAAPAARAALKAGVSDVDIAVGRACPHLPELQDVAGLHDRVSLHVDADIASLMAGSDVSVGAGGATAWERCCLGLPSIIAVLAENQSDVAAALEAAGAATIFDNSEAGWSTLPDKLGKLISSADRLQRMSNAAARVCDGMGAARVCDMVEAQFV